VLPVFSSDIIVAAEGTVFNVEAARVGGGAGLKGLTGVLPHKLLAELALIGTLRAEDLHSAGVINRVVPAEELMPTALAMARAIAKVHPDSSGHFKRSLVQALEAQGINAPEAVEDGGAASHGNDFDNEFYMRASEHGVTEAIRWRDEEFGGGAFTTSKGALSSR
jgi:enoyl-CoA hydratase/carnithine racemase